MSHPVVIHYPSYVRSMSIRRCLLVPPLPCIILGSSSRGDGHQWLGFLGYGRRLWQRPRSDAKHTMFTISYRTYGCNSRPRRISYRTYGCNSRHGVLGSGCGSSFGAMRIYAPRHVCACAQTFEVYQEVLEEVI